MSKHRPHPVIERITAAINQHDLEAIAGCFDEDVVSEQPSHPTRDFTGREQVRRNWAQILHGVPDLHAELVRAATDGDDAWAEWDWSGTRLDGARHHMRGVTVLGIRGDRATRVRFYMEPVEQGGALIDAAVREAIAAPDGS